MKKHALIAVLTLTSLNVFAASNIEGNISGYRCKVVKGSLTFTGGEKSEAKRRFYDLGSVNIFKEATVMSGGLEAATDGGIDFKNRETIVSTSSLKENSDRLYATIQETKIFDEKGLDQISTVEILEEQKNFISEYKHIYSKQSSGQSEQLEVIVRESQVTDHTSIKSATIKFEYKAPTTLPQAIQDSLNGAMNATLNCKK